MIERKVKILDVLSSQIPNFIEEENPLFKEFLRQYFISEQHQFGSTSLSEDLPKYKNISTYSNVNLSLFPIFLTENVSIFDDTINVNTTAGFPNNYGLIKIGNEIITYTEKTANTFNGCIRGFSGIDQIESEYNPEFLSFISTNSEDHLSGDSVENLSFVFLAEFYKKYKYQFIPGFENRNFQQNLSIENILTRARDFYLSKGTDTALKILFSVLFGKNVEIIKPFDNTIAPSDAEWLVAYEMIVDAIEGNPLNLTKSTIVSDSLSNPLASGAISNVEEIFLGNKKYYKILISRDTLVGNFIINNKTEVIGTGTTTSVVTVDSTIGFSDSGSFYYLDSLGEYNEVTYQSKSYNQFFDCSGLDNTLQENTKIIGNQFVYGYENNQEEQICIMRIVGSISDVINKENTKYFTPNDELYLKSLGEKTNLDDKKNNNWFYNNASKNSVLSVDPATNTIITKDYHFLYVGDKVDIIDLSNGGVAVNNATVSQVISKIQFQINSGVLELGANYIVKKRLKYVSNDLNLKGLMSDIQNSFLDQDNNTYIAFSGFPSYSDLETTNRSKTFTQNNISPSVISLNDHNFINGEKIYYTPESTSGEIVGLSTGFYYVKKVDNNNLSLCISKENVHSNLIIPISGIGTGTYKITPASLSQKNLKNQNNFKRIRKVPKNKSNKLEIRGPIGVTLNGVELYSPVSLNSIYYGQLNRINVLDGGNGYDVINPPEVLIEDVIGSSAQAYACVEGAISEIILSSPGFDYTGTPSINIIGGNGINSEAEAKIKAFIHNISFSDRFVSLSENVVNLNTDHKFLDGEEVVYTTDGLSIGIGSTNVGYSTSRLSNGGTYFIAKIDDFKFSLATTKERALQKTNLIDFLSFGNRSHTITSKKVRKIIDRIVLKNSGEKYSNKRVIIDSKNYPPQNREDLFKSFVGINTYDNYIFAKNHNFKDGEVLAYFCEGTEIAGLSTSNYYKVTILDENRFKLSNAGTSSNVSSTNYDNKIYENLESIGVGTHTFRYPPITVNIIGSVGIGSTQKADYYDASAYVKVKGNIENIFLKDGGAGYGSSDVIDYLRNPTITLKTGRNGAVKPVIDENGVIDSVYIVNPGENYTSPPELIVSGPGKYAKLRASVLDGEIVSVEIINGGTGYTQETYISVIPSGNGAKFGADLQEWKINTVARYKSILNVEEYKDTLQIKSETREKENKICSFYAPKEIRKLLNDNLDPNTFEELEELNTHSPIIGWAYDGNPIYGPYGNAKSIPDTSGTGGLKRIESSYELNPLSDSTLRPNYPSGYFIEDYVYTGNGDLDEYNGRFIINGDFPNGSYAYFSTLDSFKNPQFPYITFEHNNETDSFNYDLIRSQSDVYLNTGEYVRNITPLGLGEENRRYDFLSDPLNSNVKLKVKNTRKSGISTVFVNFPGNSYNINDKVIFDSNETIDCYVDEIIGKNIISIATTSIEVNNLVFSLIDNKVTAFSTSPHGFSDNDIVFISGITSSTYKNIEGKRVIGVNTISSTLSVAVASTTVTGYSTFISLSEPTSTGKFYVDDLIKVGNEKMLITNIDDYNNRYIVIRSYDNSTGSAHTQGKFVEKLPKEFTFNIDKKLNNSNLNVNKYYYFDSSSSVGIGSTYTSVVVGTSGSTNIVKSIPPRAIYLPGHSFNSGDELSLVSIGGTILASRNSSLTPSFSLSNIDQLYCVKLNRDYIGVSTEKVGYTTSYVYFVSANGDSHKFETIKNQITGTAKRIDSVITLDEEHNIQKNEKIRLNVNPRYTQSFNFLFDENIKKLVVNPVSFASTSVGVGSTLSTILISNHDYETGDLLLYSANDPISPLTNNQIYYAIKISDNNIRLATNKYDSTKYPNEYIGITSFGSGNHTLSKVNPKLNFYTGNTVSIATSDSSMSGYDIVFYRDPEFKARYDTSLIKKQGVNGDKDLNTKILISVGSSLLNTFYYRVEGKDLNYLNTYPSSVNEEVSNYSKIKVLESKYNSIHKVSGIGSTTITLNLENNPERLYYDALGFSSAFYSTASVNESGGIFSIKVLNPGKSLKNLPPILSVGSTTGSFVEVSVESDEIGKIIDFNIVSQGIEIPNDKTLIPKADAYTILKLKNYYTLNSIGVNSGGKDYISAPNTIAIGNSSIITKTNIEGSSVSSVDILVNDSGISKDIRFIPTINTNGVNVIGATSAFEVNTLSLRSPILGFDPFPFTIGDEIYVENVKITDSADGYNSSDYGYQYFTVTGINTISGTESISYSISGLGLTGGTFDSTYTYGRVIKKNNLAQFTPTFREVEFIEGELVSQIDGSAYGYVAKNGWDPNLGILKLRNVNGEFNSDKKIIGSIGNYKSEVDEKYEFDLNFLVSPLFLKPQNWISDKGKLNLSDQRIHDNDYYQRFSYSVRGEVDYETWKEPVNSLTHVSGFKNFSNYEIINGIGNTAIIKKEDSTIDLTVELLGEASVYDRFYYDLVSEDTEDASLSKIIKFDSKLLTDYNESRTNKVLLLDDISSQFTGIVTSLGGGLIGLSTFVLYSSANRIFYKEFDPSGINTSTSIISINDHEFNTGELLTYSENTGYPIGIASTYVSGIGSTSILPNTVYAIRVTKDQIKLAIGRSEAIAGSAVSFTSITGIGSTHSLSVETDLATSRAIISIDNILQSPLSRKDIIVSLASSVGISSTTIYLNDISKIEGNSLIKINNEIIKVNLVGVGSTNVLNVNRGYMGSVSSGHTVGASVTVLSGDYRIKDGILYFSDPPYGPSGIGSLTTKSSFHGRVFYKLNYDTNYIIDDISENFDSSTSDFDLKNNSQTLSGIQTSFGFILINNIFQRPFYGDVGSILESDYEIIGTGQTISFTGSEIDRDLPKGGIINEFSVGIGSGYQVQQRAYAYAVVSIAGTIQSIGISTGGSGYTINPRVSIADTLGVGFGASVLSSVNNGIVTSFTISNPGSGYTSSNPPLVFIDEPTPYKNLPLSGGNGKNASMNVNVGTGGSVISFEIENRGYGYSIGDNLSLTGIPYQVGIGTSAFNITVKNRYQNKFSGWTFGQLLELDDFSNLFNGFRKYFLLTRTIITKEYYSVVAQADSGIVLANNLLIFLNDVLQKPNIDYIFNGGTRLSFREAPKSGSKLKIYLYVGSSDDYIEVDVDETIKPGDRLRLQKQDNVPSQEERTIYELIASDTLETQTYGGIGIVTDSTFLRPVVWSKQTTDLIIDGNIVSKERDYLEPGIYPSTNIITSIASTDTRLYVKNVYPIFKNIDDLGQVLNDIRIVGLGTTAVTETIESVSYNGDYGLIVGIGTSATGIGTASPVLIFDIIPNPNIVNDVSISGLSTGDYFVVENTIVGSGVTSIKNNLSEIVSIGNSFIDNVYYANHIVSVGSSTLRVYSNVSSVDGITTSNLPSNLLNYGTYTWGAIDGSRGLNSKEFEFYNQNGLLGIETSANISRLLPLRLSY